MSGPFPRVPIAKGFNERVKVWIDEKYDGAVLTAAKATAIPNSTLWQIYKGMTKTPSASVLIKLSSEMGRSIDFLLTGEEHGNRSLAGHPRRTRKSGRAVGRGEAR